MRPSVSFLLPLMALPLLAAASPFLPPQALELRQVAACASGWECSLPSDAPLTARLSACAAGDTSCLCPTLPALSPTCFECYLSAASLTYEQYLSACDPFASASATTTSAKATGTGNVILPSGNGTTSSGLGAPTSLAKSGEGRVGLPSLGLAGLAGLMLGLGLA